MTPAARYASAASPATRTKVAAGKPLFAAEVYEEEAQLAPRSRMPLEAVAPALRSLGQPSGDAQADEIARLRTELRGEARALRLALSRPRVSAELLAELASLRATVDELMTQSQGDPRKGDAVSALLRARSIEGGAASALARTANKKSAGSAHARLRAALGGMVKISSWPAEGFSAGKMLIGLVGPAGVGKTTTAAKLAARARMAKKTVALVSCDAFRVGAMEQLGRYAELMDARFHTATNGDDLLRIIASETADVIIVDTSGRAIDPDATEAYLASPELRSGRDRKVELLLCLPASLRAADAARAHRDFAIAKPTAVCITKADETDAPSGIVHAAFATKLPLTTLCFGQRVPEDIAPVSEEAVSELVLGPEPKKAPADTTEIASEK